MIIVNHRRPLGLTLRQVYFPDGPELDALVHGMPATTVMRVRQTSVVVSDHPWLAQRSPCPTVVVDLTRGMDRVLAGMNQTSRRELRLAAQEKERITVTQNDRATLDAYLRLHNDFVRVSGYTTSLSGQELEEFAPVSDVFVLSMDGVPLVGHLIVVDPVRRRAVLQYSCSTRHLDAHRARLASHCNRHLHWLEMKRYAGAGIQLYDFGGIRETGNPSSQFKQGFGGCRLDEHFYVFARPAARAALRLNRAPVVQALHRLVGT